MNKRFQAKSITDEQVLIAIDEQVLIAIDDVIDETASRHADYHTASIWDVQKKLSHFPEKVVIAKLRSMTKRLIVDGCCCGCRGNFFRLPFERVIKVRKRIKARKTVPLTGNVMQIELVQVKILKET